jgi:hypothetical protein
MKTISTIAFIFIIGMMILPSCKKDSTINVPLSLTNKEGGIFIQIDTASKSFYAYSRGKISKGVLKGIFNDTIMSSFQLAIATTPRWDSVYHPADTLVFPGHYAGHTLTLEANVDLTNFTSPYHFILLGLSGAKLKSGTSGSPNIMLTIESDNN